VAGVGLSLSATVAIGRLSLRMLSTVIPASLAQNCTFVPSSCFCALYCIGAMPVTNTATYCCQSAPMPVVLCWLLQVTSEDIVLYTAAKYLFQRYPSVGTTREAAQLQLSRCIRCPHLSRFWLLSGVVASSNKEQRQQHILGQLHPHIVELASLQLAAGQQLTAAAASASSSTGSTDAGCSIGSSSAVGGTDGGTGAVLPAMQVGLRLGYVIDVANAPVFASSLPCIRFQEHTYGPVGGTIPLQCHSIASSCHGSCLFFLVT
jgi:hypothetical protein